MTSLLLALSMLLAQDKPAEKKPQVCWESLELYEDKDFTIKMAEDSLIATKYREGMPKYVKKGKEEAAKMLAEWGVELVECPKHRAEGSEIPAVDEEAKPFHLRILLAHDWDITTITLYAKFELYDADKLVITVKSEKTVGLAKVILDRKKRQEVVVSFASKMVKELSEKLKAYLKEKR